MPDASNHKSVLAFDFGLRRIGVATGQTISATASALTTLEVGEHADMHAQIGPLMEAWSPDIIVVGQPLPREDADALFAGLRRFVELLRTYRKPVVMVDEAASSLEAAQVLRNARARGKPGRIRKPDIDAEAARIIAERWLSSPHD